MLKKWSKTFPFFLAVRLFCLSSALDTRMTDRRRQCSGMSAVAAPQLPPLFRTAARYVSDNEDNSISLPPYEGHTRLGSGDTCCCRGASAEVAAIDNSNSSFVVIARRQAGRLGINIKSSCDGSHRCSYRRQRLPKTATPITTHHCYYCHCDSH